MGRADYAKIAFGHALDRVDLPGRARTTALVLAHHMSADGRTWVGQRRLNEVFDIGAKRLKADVGALVRAGLLEAAPRSGPHGSTVYRSRVRFVGDTADVILDCGRVLPAQASGHALTDAGQDAAAQASGHALTSVPSDPPARASDGSARAFERSARASGHANHHTTTPRSGGGGGGGGGVAAAFADAAASATDDDLKGDVHRVLDLIDAELAARKLKVIRHNDQLRAAILARLREGWRPQSLTKAAFNKSLPKNINAVESFVVARLNQSGSPRCLVPPSTAATRQFWRLALVAQSTIDAPTEDYTEGAAWVVIEYARSYLQTRGDLGPWWNDSCALPDDQGIGDAEDVEQAIDSLMLQLGATLLARIGPDDAHHNLAMLCSLRTLLDLLRLTDEYGSLELLPDDRADWFRRARRFHEQRPELKARCPTCRALCECDCNKAATDE